MPKRDIKLYLEDISDCIQRIEDYIKDYTFEKFDQDQKTIDAVVRNLEIIGEASKNIPVELRDKYPNVPWKRVVGFRNIVIHEYFDTDVENVWLIITKELNDLKSKIKLMLEAL